MPSEWPSNAIQKTMNMPYEGWFDYLVRAQPHHTDYAGVVWHGSYISWLEEARVEYLRSLDIHFEDLVAMGCDIPVVDLSIRYQRPLTLGTQALVKSRIMPLEGIRINWEQDIYSLEGDIRYVAARVINVAIDRERGKVLRKLPAELKTALSKVSNTSCAESS